MNKYSSKNAQGGFTLIELIVVIVILGILAATALPKFADLGKDARAASLKAAKGAIASASAMAHAQSLISNKPNEAVKLEGLTVTMVNGYPEVKDQDTAEAFAAVAGVGSEDYEIVFDTDHMKLHPVGITDANKGDCYVSYKSPAAAKGAPTIEVKSSKCE